MHVHDNIVDVLSLKTNLYFSPRVLQRSGAFAFSMPFKPKYCLNKLVKTPFKSLSVIIPTFFCCNAHIKKITIDSPCYYVDIYNLFNFAIWLR